ncbi:MAG: hypothetical protein NT069_08285, partial [Planctomycetota bacterium]|nr:hypothetical protein [Planctomycetota bacterium]
MTEHDAFVDDLMQRSDQIVAELRVDETIGRYVDDRPLPRPFVGVGPIRLVVVDLDSSSCDERRRDRSA